jgi:hypothetical protein
MTAQIYLFDIVLNVALCGFLIALIWWMFMQIQD